MKALDALAVNLDALDATFDRLLCTLSDVSSGKIDPTRLRVDLLARTWEVLPESPRKGYVREMLANGHPSLRVEGGIEGLKRLAEEEEAES